MIGRFDSVVVIVNRVAGGKRSVLFKNLNYFTLYKYFKDFCIKLS